MKFLGVTILQGVEFYIFPIDFEWALQQCSATALPVMLPAVLAVFHCFRWYYIFFGLVAKGLMLMNSFYLQARESCNIVTTAAP